MDKNTVREAVINGIKKVKKIDEVAIEDGQTYEAFGLDSLDRMNLVLELESILDVELEDVNMAEIESINKLTEYLAAQ